MVAHTWDTSTQEDQDFGASFGYMRSLRQARTVWNPVLKKKSGKQNGDGWMGAFLHENKAEIF